MIHRLLEILTKIKILTLETEKKTNTPAAEQAGSNE